MKTRMLIVLMLVVAMALGATVLACSDAQSPVVSETSDDASSATSVAEAASGSAGYVTVDVSQAQEALGQDPEAQIVDVREPSEWATTGVSPGAILIPLGQLETRAPAELAQDAPVYVICNSGSRSQTGSQILVDLGYTEVYNVDGGFQAWLAAGLPTEVYEP